SWTRGNHSRFGCSDGIPTDLRICNGIPAKGRHKLNPERAWSGRADKHVILRRYEHQRLHFFGMTQFSHRPAKGPWANRLVDKASWGMGVRDADWRGRSDLRGFRRADALFGPRFGQDPVD